MVNFPRWNIPLSKLITLLSFLRSRSTSRRGRDDENQAKISIIVCVTNVETPILRKRKEERAKGAEGSLWVGKWDIVVPPLHTAGSLDTEGEVGCEVKLWGNCAREWGDERVRRGDVILLDSEYFLSRAG